MQGCIFKLLRGSKGEMARRTLLGCGKKGMRCVRSHAHDPRGEVTAAEIECDNSGLHGLHPLDPLPRHRHKA